MPVSSPANGLDNARLARSKRVLLLIDFINPLDAFLREYRIRVPADCTAAESMQAKKASLAYMANVLKCNVEPSARAAGPAPRNRREAVRA